MPANELVFILMALLVCLASGTVSVLAYKVNNDEDMFLIAMTLLAGAMSFAMLLVVIYFTYLLITIGILY